MKRNFNRMLVLLALAILVLLFAACSKENTNKNGIVAPAVSQNSATEKVETEHKTPERTEGQEPAEEEPAEEEPAEKQDSLEGEIPTLDAAKYANHQGVVFLQAYTELIKAQRYSEAAKYFASDMLQEIGDYGYENAEEYLKDIFEDTPKSDIELVLYEVDTDYIISGITRTDGITPFSANLAEKKWVLNFAPLY